MQDRKGKHTVLVNKLITTARPLALRKQDERDIDPVAMRLQAKNAGLVWDHGRQTCKLNPDHPYYERYRQALGRAA